MSTDNISAGLHNQTRSTKFKFKSKAKRSRQNGDEDDLRRGTKQRRHEEDKESRRSRRHKTKERKLHEPLSDDQSAYDDTFTNNASSSNYIDPEEAFRESLFDAMADDEGAAFWEGVYGQPIHIYPNTKQGPEGKLEQMTDEEYAEYVRERMWEKTHQHVLEERAKREEARKRRKAEEDRFWENEERAEQARKERRAFEKEIDASLRRGEERKAQKRWQDAWQRYVTGWESFKNILEIKSKEEGSLADKSSRGIIPWPVESGKWKHVEKTEVEDFFQKAVPKEEDLMGVLKVERVRWHPDKMQQRFGANKLDEETSRAVTAVFQVVDQMWGDLRARQA
ncbi:uncharacterized protein PV09_06524 [Verruconis gallopava]|uniref:NF-kappa-B inhibitor-like protein 1 n=1 Tax=Verruconis gallopava TaxID=253628 RepID=A0A0D2AS90_9PEZI|nr:uncharacterized protein PV09_06524 [Verruconis gallopava]KIW02019.1 hypothetical protein PV09_06524 [Verruconis gallopava]